MKKILIPKSLIWSFTVYLAHLMIIQTYKLYQSTMEDLVLWDNIKLTFLIFRFCTCSCSITSESKSLSFSSSLLAKSSESSESLWSSFLPEITIINWYLKCACLWEVEKVLWSLYYKYWTLRILDIDFWDCPVRLTETFWKSLEEDV